MKQIITGTISLNDMHLKELFDLSGVEVKGDFYCKMNDLTNLKGSPHTVSGNFEFSRNDLTNLNGAPHTVKGNFDCGENPLTNLNGIPKNIGGSFYIDMIHKDKFSVEFIRSLSYIKGHVYYLNEGGWVDDMF